MYKVLLVDDEKIIREGISQLVDWRSLNLILEDTAINGEDACKKIYQLKPNIIITDIRMPKMNGLQLIETVSKQYPKIRFMILTGHQDFHYALRAMQSGVKHYLLKPTDEEKIKTVLIDIITEIKAEEAKEIILEEKKIHMDQTSTEMINIYRNKNKLIQSVIFILYSHYHDENLSLKWISSNHVFAHEKYLSRLFKQETGEGFSYFLTKVRIEKSKKHLEYGSDTIYEIAAKTGFGNNPQYFSQVFKKYTGMSPTEYREIKKIQ